MLATIFTSPFSSVKVTVPLIPFSPSGLIVATAVLASDSVFIRSSVADVSPVSLPERDEGLLHAEKQKAIAVVRVNKEKDLAFMILIYLEIKHPVLRYMMRKGSKKPASMRSRIFL